MAEIEKRTTVADLRRILNDAPDEAVLHVYLGPDGLKVQAEWRDPDELGVLTVLRAPTAVPYLGATCTHRVEVDERPTDEEQEEPSRVVDLMAALEASLAAAKVRTAKSES